MQLLAATDKWNGITAHRHDARMWSNGERNTMYSFGCVWMLEWKCNTGFHSSGEGPSNWKTATVRGLMLTNRSTHRAQQKLEEFNFIAALKKKKGVRKVTESTCTDRTATANNSFPFRFSFFFFIFRSRKCSTQINQMPHTFCRLFQLDRAANSSNCPKYRYFPPSESAIVQCAPVRRSMDRTHNE